MAVWIRISVTLPLKRHNRMSGLNRSRSAKSAAGPGFLPHPPALAYQVSASLLPGPDRKRNPVSGQCEWLGVRSWSFRVFLFVIRGLSDFRRMLACQVEKFIAQPLVEHPSSELVFPMHACA